MADLDAKDRKDLPDSAYAVPGKRQLPIPDAEHARLAWDMLDRTEGLSDEEKAEARARITAKLKALGEPMHDEADAKDRADQPDQPTEQRSADAVDSIFFLPITRIDQDQRIVEGVATSEAVDTFGTVFDYEASKQAFSAWAGNVREMHQPKAVGRKVDVRFDDEQKRIVVRTRISAGAEDTWQKILDGTLSGYSIGGRGAVWQRSEAAPPRCTKYDLVELSIVDQASNPDGRGLTLYRADGEQPDLLDDLEQAAEPECAEPATAPSAAPEVTEQAEETRVGKTISAATRDKLHATRDSLMDTCGCDECQSMRGAGDDADGDGTPDNDDPKDRLSLAAFTRALDAAIATQITPLRRELALVRVAAVSRQEAPDLTRFDPIPGKLDAVLRGIVAAEDRLAKIEAQPLPGGPAVRALADAAGLAAAEKVLGTTPQRSASHADEIAALERFAAANPGDQAVQTAIAARILSVQRGA